MNYSTLLATALAIAPAGTAWGADALPVHTPPNIILIITDQQRGDALGCMGNRNILTPNIDRLAQDGNLFTSAYSCTPSCTPARTALLTGMAPWHNGMLGYGRVADKYPVEMPQLLKDHGYVTFGIGKMHWFPQNALHGFQATIIDESGRVESPNFISDYHKWFQVNALGQNPDTTGLDWNAHGARVYQLPERLHPTIWTGNTAVETIQDYTVQKPLYLKISFARPHSPYDPPQRVLDKYKGMTVDGPARGEWSKEFANKRGNQFNPEKDPTAAFGDFGDDYVKKSKQYYYASITEIDEQVGRIIAMLKEKGMYDNSLIFFVSDHGDMMGDHNHWRKTYPYEGSAHIPLIVKFPKNMERVVSSGNSIPQPVELRDLLPTALELAGIDIPKEVDGSSLTQLVQTKTPHWRRWIDLEHAQCYSKDNYWAAMTDGKIKYIWYWNGTEQLFDLVKDPKETKNIVTDSKYRNQLKELRTALADHLKERGDDWVKDGKLQIRNQSMLYSPNYKKYLIDKP